MSGEGNRFRRPFTWLAISIALFMGSYLGSLRAVVDEKLDSRARELMEAQIQGDWDRLLQLYDEDSWKVIAKPHYLSGMKSKGHRYSKISSWKLACSKHHGRYAYTRIEYVTGEEGWRMNLVDEIQWKRTGGLWKVTLDHWPARNRDRQLWSNYSSTLRLNDSELEPDASLREEIAKQTEIATALIARQQWEQLAGMSSPVTLLCGPTSWDVHYALTDQWRQGWGFSGLSREPLSAGDVVWVPRGLDLLDPQRPRSAEDPTPYKSISCWEVFVPYRVHSPSCEEKSGVIFTWIRTGEGLRLAEVRRIGCVTV